MEKSILTLEQCDKDILDILIRDFYRPYVVTRIKDETTFKEFLAYDTTEYFRMAVDYYHRGINKLTNELVHPDGSKIK